MNRVFVVSEPLKWDPQLQVWVRSINLSPARKFGELFYLLPPNNESAMDPSVIIATLYGKLADFSENDYLLPVGSPVHIAFAAAIAARNAGGKLNLLHWQPKDREYVVVKGEL